MIFADNKQHLLEYIDSKSNQLLPPFPKNLYFSDS